MASDHNLNKTNNEEKKYSSSSTLYDRILHLHTWMHEDCTESIDLKDCKVLIVVGVYESGCVKVMIILSLLLFSLFSKTF